MGVPCLNDLAVEQIGYNMKRRAIAGDCAI